MTFKVQVIKYCSIICFVSAVVAFLGFLKNVQNSRTPVKKYQEVNFNELEVIKENGLVFFNGKPFNGKANDYYENAILASTTNYKDGLKHGAFMKYFRNGEVSFKGDYVNGQPHGFTYSWWNNGKLRSKSSFTNGIGQGEQWQWYKSGAKFKKIQLVNGKEEGMQQSWRENGKLYNNYEAKNGRIFGLKRSKLCFSLENEVVQK